MTLGQVLGVSGEEVSSLLTGLGLMNRLAIHEALIAPEVL